MANTKNDLAGQRFGKLLAIRELPDRINKQVIWELKCDCGITVFRKSCDVKRARDKLKQMQSCGCHQELNLAGEYGNFTVLEKAELTKRGRFWICKCRCGNTFKKLATEIKNNHGAMHCGCIKQYTGRKSASLIGRKFSKLTVIEYIDSPGHATWKCKCDCGKEIITKGMYLRRGTRRDCGCTKRPKYSTRFTGIGELYRSHWTKIIEGATSRKLDFTITMEYAWELFLKQNGKCALSGEPIVLGRYGVKTASLDRIDSKRGYVEGNVQWVHKTVNVSKWSMNNEEYIELCRKIYEHNK